MLKHVFCFWSDKFDHIASWWEDKNNLAMSIGQKDAMSRFVVWEGPLHISELHTGIRGTCQTTAKSLAKICQVCPYRNI